MRRPELLIPASSLEVLKIAVIYGADAVYIGGEAFGLRAKAKNFSMEEMREGIRFAHEHEVKVYVTANILAHNDDLEGKRRRKDRRRSGTGDQESGRRSRKGQGRCMRRRQVLPERHTRSHGSQGWRYRSDQPQCRSDRQAGRRGTDTGI